MTADPIQVLLIDDDPADAHLSAGALRVARRPMYEVHHVATLADAFKAIRSKQYDVVLLDLGLPGSRGLETLNLFRDQDDSTPVVVLSGLEDEDVAFQSLECDAQDYLFKNNVTRRTLPRAIRYAIQRQASIAENRRLLVKVKENEELLLRKNERLKTLCETAHCFVDNVSHDFRTPLTVIKEYISLVSDGTTGEITDEQRHFLSIAEDRANDLNNMVDDMLDVSKLESGLLRVYRKPHDARKIIDQVMPSLSQKANIKKLTLDVKVADNLPRVFCDDEKIKRVIINLAVNAVKFVGPGGHVEIWARGNGDSVEIGITDNGPGIAKDLVETVFERFKQVDATDRTTKGFGLGLGIAMELVELNLGDIRVESEVGVGSTFSFTVPVADPAVVMERYTSKLIRGSNDFVTLIRASINNHASKSDADCIDSYLHHLVRSNDLTFRAEEHRWLMVLPEPKSEAQVFLERAVRELQLANRNRPRGPLPEVDFQLEGSWSDLRITTEEVLSCTCAKLDRSEVLHA